MEAATRLVSEQERWQQELWGLNLVPTVTERVPQEVARLATPDVRARREPSGVWHWLSAVVANAVG